LVRPRSPRSPRSAPAGAPRSQIGCIVAGQWATGVQPQEMAEALGDLQLVVDTAPVRLEVAVQPSGVEV
jgi:hypothetical protein